MNTANKILELPEAKKLADGWKRNGLKIVFTNGCFDILHLGHIDYLEKSRNLGDKLIVGVNRDASINNIKGPNRPVVNEYARARVIAALEFVDTVILFAEDTPENLILSILPDILVKGDDYTIDKIVGADIVIKNGGKVQTIELVKGYSTSKIIDKIKNT
ncbi:MAG: rfaE2 [Chitinophagaceae bacterium]|nr:rfaE2 [Chitinophagaceae bacterium]